MNESGFAGSHSAMEGKYTAIGVYLPELAGGIVNGIQRKPKLHRKANISDQIATS